MPTAVITLNGNHFFGDKPQTIKQVNFATEKILVAHLKDLQKPYLIDNDRVKIAKHILPFKNGKTRKVIDASSYSDWHYVAHIGLKLKESSPLPIETII